MIDYIKRKDALEFCKVIDTMFSSDGRLISGVPKSLYFRAYINSIKAADVRENVHAQWYHKPYTYGAFCSHCHSWQYPDAVFENYCPHCGAIMDGGVEE